MLILKEETESTNEDMQGMLEKLASGTALAARKQTAGRGRGGHIWKGAEGGLYFTLLVKEKLAVPSALPLYAALQCREAVQRFTGLSLDIKWPNDLLLNGKKIAGILCGAPAGGYLCGVGLNLSQPAAYFAKNGLPFGGSLLSEGKAAIGFEQAAEALQEALLKELPLFCKKGFAPFLPRYTALCVNLGREVRSGEVRGVAVGISPLGELEVACGGERRLLTGEAHLAGFYGEPFFSEE